MKKSEIISARIENSLRGWGEYRRHFATTDKVSLDNSEAEIEEAIFQGQFPEREVSAHVERIADVCEESGFFEVWAHYVTAYPESIPAAFYNEEI